MSFESNESSSRSQRNRVPTEKGISLKISVRNIEADKVVKEIEQKLKSDKYNIEELNAKFGIFRKIMTMIMHVKSKG